MSVKQLLFLTLLLGGAMLVRSVHARSVSHPCACCSSKQVGIEETELFTLTLANNTSLIGYGFLEKNISDEEIEASAVEVFNYLTGESLVKYGPLQHCQLKIRGEILIIRELIRVTWPHKNRWKEKFIPYRERQIFSRGEQTIVSDGQDISPTPKLSKRLLKKLHKTIAKNKKSSFQSHKKPLTCYLQTLIEQLFVAALAQDIQAIHAFENFAEFFNYSFHKEACLLNHYQNFVKKYQWLKNLKKKSKPPKT